MTTPGERCEIHAAKRYLPYEEQEGWRVFCDPANPTCAQANYGVIKPAEDVSLADSLRAVEAFFAAKGVPFYLVQKPDSAPLTALEPLLAQRGYTVKTRTLWRLMHCLQPSPLLRVNRCRTAPMRAALDNATAALLRERTQGTDAALRLTARKLAGGAKGFVACDPAGAPVSYCIGEGYGGAFCITDVYTVPGQRRKGYGAAAVLALLQFANDGERGYEDIFLFVEDGPARTLFEQTGFRGLRVEQWAAWKQAAPADF